MSLAILFHFLCAQHVSDINISTIRSLRLFLLNYHISRVILVRYVLEFQCGWVGQQKKSQAPDDGYINVWNMLVSYSSTITMMHVPINIRFNDSVGGGRNMAAAATAAAATTTTTTTTTTTSTTTTTYYYYIY